MIFNYQNLRCRWDVKSVSGTHTFVKGETYRFAVIQHSEGTYDCVFKFPHHNGELVDTRYFDDYDCSFINQPYFQVISTFNTIDKKNRITPCKEILFGGSEIECNVYFENYKKEQNIDSNIGSGETDFMYRNNNIYYTISMNEI